MSDQEKSAHGGGEWMHCHACAIAKIKQLRRLLDEEKGVVTAQANRIRDLVSENFNLNKRIDEMQKAAESVPVFGPLPSIPSLDSKIAELQAKLDREKVELAKTRVAVEALPLKKSDDCADLEHRITVLERQFKDLDKWSNEADHRVEELERRNMERDACEKDIYREIRETDEAAEELAHRVEELEDTIKEAQKQGRI